jgi:hypothetical protein
LREKNAFSFAVLSDTGNRLADQFGVVITPSDGALKLQRSRGLDLTEHNADGTGFGNCILRQASCHHHPLTPDSYLSDSEGARVPFAHGCR